MKIRFLFFAGAILIGVNLQAQKNHPYHFFNKGNMGLSQGDQPSDCPGDSANPIFVVPPSTAIPSIANYGELVGEKCPKDVINDVPKYWNVCVEKLRYLTQFDDIHVYIGINNQDESHLYLVGVNDGEEDLHSIVNLIEPCPHSCDTVSSSLTEAFCSGILEGLTLRRLEGDSSSTMLYFPCDE
ncbi:hypothetical protein KFE98_01170 [bacterium SCSIO 12741]|nr:hypothetical protein KFE98_01170 [bacterium SCSIO 12741]